MKYDYRKTNKICNNRINWSLNTVNESIKLFCSITLLEKDININAQNTRHLIGSLE